jgi:hypothetical protein
MFQLRLACVRRYLEHKRKEAEQEAEIMKHVGVSSVQAAADSCRMFECLQVPHWVAGEPTTRQRWLPPIESWAKRSLI